MPNLFESYNENVLLGDTSLWKKPFSGGGKVSASSSNLAQSCWPLR